MACRSHCGYPREQATPTLHMPVFLHPSAASRRSAALHARCWASLTLVTMLALAACGRAPAPTAKVLAPGVPTRPAPAAPLPLAQPGGPQPLAELTTADSHWPAETPVDVLVLADAPTLDPAGTEAALAPAVSAWRALGGVERVYTRAMEGQIRAVVRFSAGTAPSSAADAVRAAWQRTTQTATATPRIETLARGARVRLLVTVLAPAGRPEATRWVADRGAAWLAAMPGLTRAGVAGAVRPYLLLEPLAPGLDGNGLDLERLVARLMTLPEPAPAATSPDSAVDLLKRLTVPRNTLMNNAIPATQDKTPATELARLVSFMPGAGEPVREARNGKLAVTALLGHAAANVSDASLAAQDSAWRRQPELVQALAGGWDLRGQMVSTAHRFALVAPPGVPPEAVESLAQRLQKVRELPEVTSVVAMQGTDGIPEGIDVDAGAGRRWTVWIAGSFADSALTISSAIELLRGPSWQVQPLPADWDTALGWMLGVSGTTGLLASAPAPDRLPPAMATIGRLIHETSTVAVVQNGPQRRPPEPRWSRLAQVEARQAALRPDTLALAQDLVLAPRFLRLFAGKPLWLGLPRDERSAQQGNLPVARSQNRSWKLGELQQLPASEPVLERIGVDQRPAAWLTADVPGAEPEGFGRSFWEAIEARVEWRAGLRVDPLVLGVRPLAAPATLPSPTPRPEL